jgi:transaldolase
MDLLHDITKISSGKLAGQNCWTLGPDVLLKVQQKGEEDNQKKTAVENQKEIQKQKDWTQF